MYPEDMKIFLRIVELIESGELDHLSKICFITGVLAGLNWESSDISEKLMDLPEMFSNEDENNVVNELIDMVKDFKD